MEGAPDDLAGSIGLLQRRVEELESTLRALTTGEADALPMEAGAPGGGSVLYNRSGADEPYRLIVEHLGAGVATLSSRGVVLYANARLAELAGCARHSLLGRSLGDLLEPCEGERLPDLQALPPGRFEHTELMLCRPAGPPLPVLATLSRLPAQEQEMDTLCLVVSDPGRTQIGDATGERTLRSLRLLVENASAFVVEVDTEQRIRWVTGSIRSVLGWEPEEVIGRPLSEWLHPEDRLELDGKEGLVVRLRSRDGAYPSLRTLIRPLSPRGAGWFGSFQSVEELVRQRRINEVERERLTATLDSLPDPHVVVEIVRDGQGTIAAFHYADANPAACQQCGLSRAELIGHSLLEVYPAPAGTRLFEFYRQAAESSGPLVLLDVALPLCRSREERRYDIRAVRVGERMSFSWRDVSERDAATRRIAESERKYRLLAENSSDVVFHSRQGTIQWVSPSLSTMLGWSPEEWIDQSITSFVHPEDRAILPRALESLRAGKSVEQRFRIRARDGTYRWIELHARLFLGEDRRADGEAASFRMVDDRVAIERELQRLAHTDALTGLANRQSILDRLTELLRYQQRRGDHGLALAFCDLDGFKRVNDDHGHEAGDIVLRTVADRIRRVVRGEDTVARIGGDELLVVFDGVADLQEAMAVAEKIRVAVSEPVPLPQGSIGVSLSIGVTLARRGESIDTLIARADEAMYRAKRSGRNQVIPIEGGAGSEARPRTAGRGAPPHRQRGS